MKTSGQPKNELAACGSSKKPPIAAKLRKRKATDNKWTGRGEKAQTRTATLPRSKEPEVVGVPAPDATWTRDRLIAKIAIDGVMANAVTTQTYASVRLGDMSVSQATDTLRDKIKASKQGSTALADELLVSQAIALNSIASELLCRAAANIGHNPALVECYMRLGLKAQNQSRATLESLARIKNPPNVAFVKQANIAQNQQVNNLQVSADPPARTEKPESAPIELLENNHGEWMVSGAKGETVGGNSALEALGTINGAADKRRKGQR
jgi:hypothetical protein